MKRFLKNGIALSKLNPVRKVGMKLFLFFFVFVLLMVAVVGVSSYVKSKEIVKEEVSQASQGTIVQTRARLDMLFKQYDDLATSFMADRELSLAIIGIVLNSTDQEVDPEFLTTYEDQIKHKVYTDDNLVGITLFDLKGGTLSKISKAGTFKHIEPAGDKAWFNEALEREGQSYWIDMSRTGIHDPSTTPTFGVIKYLVEQRAVVLLELNIKAIQSQLDDLEVGGSGQFMILSAQDELQYHSDYELIGSKSFVHIPADNSGAPLLTGSEEVVDGQGHSQLVVFSRSEHTGWYVAGSFPVGDLVKNTKQIRDFTIGALAISALVAIVLSLVIVRMIASPLIQLRNLMNEGATGNLAVRIRTGSRDEIGQLGESFNQMMEQLDQLVRQTHDTARQVFDTSTSLSDASKSIALSAKEVSTATEEIAGGAATLAAEAERGNGATAAIGEKMGEVIELNAQMGQIADEVQQASDTGTASMKELIARTMATEEITRSMVEKIEQLKTSTLSIRSILDVLESMTKQTNILSLNATIEAARAGAAGKGFMVVADEIRKLADQSKQNIEVVGQITRSIQSEIEETVGVLSKAAPLFQEQLNSVRDTEATFGDVKKRMNEFAGKLDETIRSVHELHLCERMLTEAMGNVGAVSEQASAASQEVASLAAQQQHAGGGLVHLSDHLSKLSLSLKEALNRFKLEESAAEQAQ